MTGVLSSTLEDSEALCPEELVLCHDRDSGLRAVIALDDTSRGPGLGGVRWMRYPGLSRASDEACRLARVMTLKNAFADLPFGGAKSVILRDDRPVGPDERRSLMRAFGGYVQRLNGAYLPGVDMGTTTDDLAEMATVAGDVSCDHQDPSPLTALGVLAAVRAAVGAGADDGLNGTSVLVQGAGHVGASLATMLAASGARVAVADVDADRAARVAARVGGRTVAPGDVVSFPCDVFAPCATARVVTTQNVDDLRCRVVCGAANDILAERACAAALADRGITYVPDFVANAGGVVAIWGSRAGLGAGATRQAVLDIGSRVAAMLAESQRSGTTPLVVAEAMASERLGRPVHVPD